LHNIVVIFIFAKCSEKEE